MHASRGIARDFHVEFGSTGAEEIVEFCTQTKGQLMSRNLLVKLQLSVMLTIASLGWSQKVPAKEAAERAEKILRQMTLEEKVSYIGGVNDMYIRAVPRVGIPELKMSDGPIGVRDDSKAIAYPAGIALAASWDVNLAKRMGSSMGRDARARGIHFLLGPGVNIYRAPMCGRNFEYFGEDPFLSSRLAVAEIEGIQSESVIAVVKHFAGNNQEWDRYDVSSDIDERTLREVYLPAFEYAVKEAHVGAIMDSYNLLNGVHMTQNGRMNNDLLRGEWGFTGVAMSDWDSTYDGVKAANSGLDLEMPSGKCMSPAVLLEAVRSGVVKESTIDDKVRHILQTTIAFGFFDRPQKLDAIPLNDPESRAVALKVAQESVVLLKNDGILPLNKARLHNIAIIGPNAGVAVTGGGGSSLVQPFEAQTPVDAVKALVGPSVDVSYKRGVMLASDLFRSTRFTTTSEGNTPGMTAEFFNNRDLNGPPALTRTDQNISFNWGEGSYISGGPADNFSARWIGFFTPEASGEYAFTISGDDGFRLYVDDRAIVDQWRYQGETLVSKSMPLVLGHHYKVRLEYFEGTGQASIGLGISNGVTAATQEAIDAARHADAVILSVGFNDKVEGEGADRSFELPLDQLTLIHSVQATNRNTVLVLNAGGNVDMTSFSDSTPALLHTWYAGQEGATALAQILFGEVNPSGKLPVSFERRWEDNATYNSYYDKHHNKRVAYSEGIFLGYRHFDQSGIKPMFPFGFGLSYSTFLYSGLQISGPTSNDSVGVTFQVTNTGARLGAEVAEVFVGEKHPMIPRPVKELKGFARVELKPGETRSVTVNLDRRAFAHYDANSQSWQRDPGEFEIMVGGSSDKIELKGTVKLSQPELVSSGIQPR
jgi:beta-glucosidase